MLFCACLSEGPGEASCHFAGEQSFFEGTGRQNCISHSLMWAAEPDQTGLSLSYSLIDTQTHTDMHSNTVIRKHCSCINTFSFTSKFIFSWFPHTHKHTHTPATVRSQVTIKLEKESRVATVVRRTSICGAAPSNYCKRHRGHTDTEEGYFCVTLECSANNPSARKIKTVLFIPIFNLMHTQKKPWV